MGFQADKGALLVSFSYRGRRFREYLGVKDTVENRRRYAPLWKRLERDLQNGTFDYLEYFPDGRHAAQVRKERAGIRATQLLGEYLPQWLRERCPYRADGSVIAGPRCLRPSTWENERLIVTNRLIPVLGHHELSELTKPMLRTYKRWLLEQGGRNGAPYDKWVASDLRTTDARPADTRLKPQPGVALSPKTVNNVMGVLSKALADAVEDDLVERNVTPRLDGGGDLRAPPDPFSIEEIHLILEQVGPHWRSYYRVWFATGWRSSEMTGIRCEWLDWRHEAVELRLGWYPRWNAEAAPKTGPRFVDCSYDRGIFEALREQKLASVRFGQPEYVFFDENGEPANQENLHDYVLTPALRRAGIRHRGSYNVRDTFISHALSNGESIAWVASVCGNSIAQIEKHYHRYMPNRRRDQGTHVADAIFGSARILPESAASDEQSAENSSSYEATPTGFEPLGEPRITSLRARTPNEEWAFLSESCRPMAPRGPCSRPR